MKPIKRMVWAAVWITAAAVWADAGEWKDRALPAPRTDGGLPLMQALMARQSQRAFAQTPLPPQVLADLLWAANGVNRPDSGKRTAPTARNWQEIDIYVILPEGVYRYDAAANMLRTSVKGDVRPEMGGQAFAVAAPVNLAFVADTSRMRGATPDSLELYKGVDTGYVSQNVYLFCASEGLATVVRGLVDRPRLAAALKLAAHQQITFVQTVGYPAPAAP